MEIVDLLEYSERRQLREWFEQYAATEKCCWVAMSRSKKPLPGVYLLYIDVVEEALCFGWIDTPSSVCRTDVWRNASRLGKKRAIGQN